jgi:fatty acid synthase subunit alpha
MVVKVETYNGRDVKVLDGTTEVAQHSHCLRLYWPGFSGAWYGHGRLYSNSSAAARAVWDAADAHLARRVRLLHH